MTPQPPPAIRSPEAPPNTEEQEKLEEKRRQRRMIYSSFFSTENGRAIVADLKAQFGFVGDFERCSYVPGGTHADMTFIEGQKEVVRYILEKQVIPPEKAKPKPSTATN